MKENNRFYSVKELAKILNVTEMTIYRLMRRGELSYHQIGRAKRFSSENIKEFLKKTKRKAKKSTS
jgi:excisionase family DNA binding protein